MHLSAMAMGILGGAGIAGVFSPRVGFAVMIGMVIADVLLIQFGQIKLQP